mgnify:CR=1 FL=1
MYKKVLHHIKASDLRETADLTLRFRDNLNEKFWINGKLRPEVRRSLMNFAKAFADYVDLNDVAIIDVLMLGGNAGYNYTKFSDIDVHLVVDTKYIPQCDPNLIDDYYMDKKTLWELTHDVKIYGAPVEPYIERPGVVRKKSQGVYSVLKNYWIQEPTKFEDDFDENELIKKTRNLKNKIDTLIKSEKPEALKSIVKKLRVARSSSLDKFGEYGFENLVFKELRNSGYIDKVRSSVLSLKNKSLSLK